MSPFSGKAGPCPCPPMIAGNGAILMPHPDMQERLLRACEPPLDSAKLCLHALRAKFPVGFGQTLRYFVDPAWR